MTGFRNMDRSGFDKGLVDVFVEYTSGATGAIPATLTHANGVASVSRTSAGLIKVTLQDGYLGLAGADGSVIQASLSAVTGFLVTPATALQGAATPTVSFNILGQDGTSKLFVAADTAVGDVVRLHLVLRRL